MLYRHLLYFYLALLYACICSARPNPASPQLSYLTTFNLTIPSALSQPKAGITCFTSGPRTTVAGCRVALNYMKEFPLYKTVQPFQQGRCPDIGEGKKPPLLIFAQGATCAIEIATRDPLVVDAFSFEEVRQLATEIVEDCQDVGGHGGWSPVGRGIGWHVRVIGVDVEEGGGGGNGRVLLKGAGVGVGNGTLGMEGVLNGS